MLVRVPSIPSLVTNRHRPVLSHAEIIDRVSNFISAGNVTVLTGAGVSVDSGIKAYRGHDGRYLNPNFKPIFYHELVANTPAGFAFRQRYWLRSYLGYSSILRAQPNTTHLGLAALQCASYIPRLITQNVDGLHHKALSLLVPDTLMPDTPSILELHGTLHSVRCSRGHVVSRSTFQELLSATNPKWREFLDNAGRTGIKTNPDGDAEIEGLSYDDFVIPECPTCMADSHLNSNHKPDVIFFGESIPDSIKERSYLDVDMCDRFLVIGTTLATYSAFRLLKHSLSLRKPVLMINVGPSRADDLPEVEKFDVPTGSIIEEVTKAILGHQYTIPCA